MIRARMMTRCAAAAGLIMLMWACDRAGRSSSPTTPSLDVPLPAYTLSGVIVASSETGPIPVEGVRVQLWSRQAAVTDKDGVYTIPAVTAGITPLSATKDGYVTATRTLTISGDTRFDIAMSRVVPRPTFILSGVVFEIAATGPEPVEGVEVYCDSCGSPVGHTFVYTDPMGFYSFSWAYDGLTPLLVKKAGYQVVGPIQIYSDGTGQRNATVNGDTRFDIQLVRR